MSLTIFQSETTLILAERPGDEVRQYGDLIATLCRAGRPPFVVVLSDGTLSAGLADRRVRAGLEGLGLATGRMLMFGIAGDVPTAGPVFEAAVQAVCFVSWRHDCNVLCVASETPAVHTLASAAVEASGLGLVTRPGGTYRLVAAPRRSARDAGQG